MVITRSQSNRTNLTETEIVSDNESDHSIPEMLSRDQTIEFDNGDLLNYERNNDRNRIGQLGELTNIVSTLTEKIFSNIREGNGINVMSNEPNSRSDSNYNLPFQLLTISTCCFFKIAEFSTFIVSS